MSLKMLFLLLTLISTFYRQAKAKQITIFLLIMIIYAGKQVPQLKMCRNKNKIA